jgi:hypothetical protein
MADNAADDTPEEQAHSETGSAANAASDANPASGEDAGNCRKRLMRPDMLMAIAAFITSIAAIWVAWEQSRLMRVQQHASMQPILVAEIGMDNEKDELSFTVRNVGVGPALVKSASLQVGEQTLASFEGLSDLLIGDNRDTRLQLRYFDVVENRPLAVGQAVRMLGLGATGQDMGTLMRGVVARSDRPEDWPALEVCYCSIFDRCWITRVVGEPVRIEACPAPTGWFDDVMMAFFEESRAQEAARLTADGTVVIDGTGRNDRTAVTDAAPPGTARPADPGSGPAPARSASPD